MRKTYYIAAIILLPKFLHAQADSSEKKWSGNAAMYYYYVPGENIPPTITGYTEHNNLHIETRFNYEDVNSLSVFAGKKFEKDKSGFTITVTPMAGILVGRTDGVLPGLEFDITKSIFELYSENEYLFSFAGKYGNFFYSWTELNVETIKNLKAGLAAQTLRFYKTNFDIQKGFYGEYETGRFLFDAYYFNPFSKYDFFTAAVNYNF